MDEARFAEAFEKTAHNPSAPKGIGTLSEKTLHAVLKNYYEPCEAKQETRIGSYIADIAGENGIIEIQTGNFNKLRKKLEVFLEISRVTVVYPIASTKWLLWIEKETGEVTNKRKSPKIGTPYESFSELYKIKQLLGHENLKLCFTMVDIEEYRYLDGYGRDRKRRASRCERIPVGIKEEVCIESKADYRKLIPDSLDEKFTSKDYKRESGLSISHAQTALNVLSYVGSVKRVGKIGNLYLYERNSGSNYI